MTNKRGEKRKFSIYFHNYFGKGKIIFEDTSKINLGRNMDRRGDQWKYPLGGQNVLIQHCI